ncbi:MAG TPA: C13 family peptidase [Bryobacteraceae bacterium]|nr:C13 family peptidase [Bryobacteraceae bacterium]
MHRIGYAALMALTLAASARAETFYLTIAGLGGEQEYEQRFTGWAKELEMILRGEPNAKLETLMGAQATRANIQAKLADFAKQAKADDNVILFLIGHGGFDEADYKFNVPGPDVSATDLANWLDKIPAHQLIVNMTSCSGGSIPVLQKSKRVVITATKSGTERNATVFARFWIEALRDPAADADKNEVITALEAFRYAEAKTAKYYEESKRLATEHPLMEDAGKGEGVKNPSTENGEGLTAGRFSVLHTGSAVALAKDPEKQKLLKAKEDIEQKIDDLKYRKASMSVEDYRQQLAKLLVDLAKTQEELDK